MRSALRVMYRALAWGQRLLCWLLQSYPHPAWQRRRQFELKNLGDPKAQSFKLAGLQAQLALEVSSEGELEQVRELLLTALERGLRVELVLCSPSVERACLQLAQRYGELRVLRLPLVSLERQRLGDWLTAPRLCLCRYDFFPELMDYGLSRAQRFVLIAAKRSPSRPPWLYRCFDALVPASTQEEAYFRGLTLPGRIFPATDLRMGRIWSRVGRAREVLTETPWWRSLEQWLQEAAPPPWILGSCYPEESEVLLSLLRHPQQRLLLCPHQLDDQSIHRWKTLLAQLKVAVSFLSKDQPVVPPQARVVLLREKGLLCELYRFFRYAYVGGGFRGSVHSLLEPLVAQCLVVCGPAVQRSSEYQLIQQEAPAQLMVLGMPQFDVETVTHHLGEGPGEGLAPELWGQHKEDIFHYVLE